MAEFVELSGYVKRYNQDTGYGFVTTDKGDVFVHAKTLRRDGWTRLPKGSDVSVIAVKQDDGRWRAERIIAVRLAQ